MLYRRILRPALFRLAGGDPEGAHDQVLSALAAISRSPLLTQALTFSAAAIGREDSQAIRAGSIRAALPPSSWAGGGLRQERAGDSGAGGLRLRLRRSRHRDTRGAAGQSSSAPLSPAA